MNIIKKKSEVRSASKSRAEKINKGPESGRILLRTFEDGTKLYYDPSIVSQS